MYQCKVWLDNYAGQYFPGSVIQGKVVLNFESETSFRAIKIRFKGEEHTEWLGEESYFDSTENKNTTRQVLFTGDNEVLSHQIVLFGGESGTSTLPAGQHFYPFTFTLPNNLPGTYTCPLGSILFKIIGIVDRPMRQDYEDVALVTVASPIDLNKLGPEVSQPVSYSDDTTVCCFCCASGPITMDAELSRQAMVPGESATINVRLTNQSNVNVENVTLELKQTMTYRTLSPSDDKKVEEFVLVNVPNAGVGAHGDNTYNIKVDIPTTTVVPNFDQCRLFNVEYNLVLTAALPSYHSNLVIKMNPTIGNIPICSQPPAPSNFTQPTGPYPTLPPGGPQFPPATGDNQGYPPNNYPPTNGNHPQYPPPNMGGQSPNMGGPPPNMGGPPYMGGQPPNMGGQPPNFGGQSPNMGGPPQNMGGPPPNFGGPPPNMGYPAPNMGYPPYQPPGAGGGYPQGPGASVPTAPFNANNPKADEAAQTNSRPNAPQDFPPPTYDSLNLSSQK